MYYRWTPTGDDPTVTDDDSGPRADEPSSVDRRTLALALLAVLGLAVAGIVAPPLPDADDAGDDGLETSLLDALVRLLEFLFETDGTDPDPDPDCRIELHSEPVPGTALTVTVRTDGTPVEGAVVWFEDRRVGRTDREGRVTGEVPYSRELRIRVVEPSIGRCEAVVGESERERIGSEPPLDGRSPPTTSASVGALEAGVGPEPFWPAVDATGAQAADDGAEDGGSGEDNATVQVRGRVTIAVEGEPYPGEPIDVVASVRGVPMERATVAVDGERVGRTDGAGRATVVVPDDAGGRLTITVERGDFSGTERVRVLDLSVSLRTDRLLLVPGGTATAVGRVGARPAADASLVVDGEPRGTLDADGRRAIRLPVDPSGQIVVATERQTASVSLLALYWLPALLLGAVVVVLALLAARLWGATGAAAVVGAVGTVLAVVLVEAYFGRDAGLAALATVVAIVVLAAVVGHRRIVADAASDARRFPSAVVEGFVAVALGVARSADRLLGWLVPRVRGLVSWLRSLPRSVSGLVGRLLAWFPSVLATLRSSFVGWTTVGVVVGVVLAAAGGYAVAGGRGVAAVVALLLAGAIAWWYVSRTPAASADPPDDAVASSAERSSSPPSDPTQRPLRAVWRAFARRVAPGRWRTLTPVEVARRAVAAGYPAGPVETLARAFRAVEYGNHDRTTALTERAREAYGTIADRAGASDTAAAGPEGTAESPGDAPRAGTPATSPGDTRPPGTRNDQPRGDETS